jgi:hypothetical protein
MNLTDPMSVARSLSSDRGTVPMINGLLNPEQMAALRAAAGNLYTTPQTRQSNRVDPYKAAVAASKPAVGAPQHDWRDRYAAFMAAYRPNGIGGGASTPAPAAPTTPVAAPQPAAAANPKLTNDYHRRVVPGASKLTNPYHAREPARATKLDRPHHDRAAFDAEFGRQVRERQAIRAARGGL